MRRKNKSLPIACLLVFGSFLLMASLISGNAKAVPSTAPEAPTGLTATPGDGKVTLSWNSVSGVTGYNVYRSTTSGIGFTKINTELVTEATYEDSTVTNGITYYYQVKSVKDSTESSASSEVSASPTGDGIIGDFCGANFGPPDGYVDVWDLMQFADQWHTRTSQDNWEAKFDLTGPDFGNLDDYVDVWDLMVFADNWHKGCTFTISPIAKSFTASGGDGSVTVTTSNGCAWTATSHASWIIITSGSSGSGSGTIGYSVAANGGTAERTGTMTISGHTFTVTQAKPTTDIPSAPTGVTASAGDGQVSISWSAVSGATSYNIYWSTTSGVTKTNGIKITGATSPYSHTGRTNDTTYYYVVTAVNSAGESEESSEVSATPTPPTEEGVWSNLSNGLEDTVNSLAFYNGNLCAASYGVALWDGSTWNDMSKGLLGLYVYALANFNDVLFAGGFFTVLTPDGNWYNNTARFHNGYWTTCGSGTGDDGMGMSDPVNYLIEYNGQLYAGGRFGSAGGDPLYYRRTAAFIASFYGGQWHPVGGGMDDTVTDMVVYNGELIVSGYFNKADWLTPTGEDYNPNPVLANYIAKWNGVNWSPFGSGMDGRVTALAVHNGELYAGGLFENAGGVPARNIAKWNGQSWSPVGNGIGGQQVYTLASYNNELYAGGEFRTISGNAGNYIMSWDGTQWKSVGSGTDGPVITLLPDSSGLIVSGSFSTAGNVSANNIAKYSVTR